LQTDPKLTGKKQKQKKRSTLTLTLTGCNDF
jgi:hypothetical protein